MHLENHIYRALYPQYYHLDRLDAEKQQSKEFHTGMSFYHASCCSASHYIFSEHCLHTLKEAVMFQIDTALIAMKWGHRNAVPIEKVVEKDEGNTVVSSWGARGAQVVVYSA